MLTGNVDALLLFRILVISLLAVLLFFGWGGNILAAQRLVVDLRVDDRSQVNKDTAALVQGGLQTHRLKKGGDQQHKNPLVVVNCWGATFSALHVLDNLVHAVGRSIDEDAPGQSPAQLNQDFAGKRPEELAGESLAPKKITKATVREEWVN